MKAVKWGIIGVAGHFLLRVAKPISESPIIDILAIASRSGEKAKKAANIYNIPKVYKNYQDILKDKEIEAVYIPLPNNMHYEWIKKAADAGKHILCEKPLCLTFDEVKEVIDYTNKKGVLLMEAFMYKFHPQWLKVKEVVTRNEIGKVQSIHTRFFYFDTNPDSIHNQLELGGGALRDIGCYGISVPRFILGKEPKRVLSLIYRDKEFKVDSLTTGLLDFGDVQSIFTVSIQTDSFQEVNIHGTEGNISIKLPFNMYPDVPSDVAISTNIGIRNPKPGPADQYKLEFEAFSEAVRGLKDIPIPPEDALNNQKVIDALFKSEEIFNWVNL